MPEALAVIPAFLGSVGTGIGSLGAGLGGALATGAADLGLAIPAGVTGAIGTGLVDAGVGAGLGALTGAVTGGSPLKGAEIGGLGGAALGGITSLLGGAAPGATAGAAGSAAGSAAPASVAPAAADVTAANALDINQAGAGITSAAAPTTATGALTTTSPLSLTTAGPLATAATPAAAAPAASTSSGGFLGGLESQIAKNPLALVGAGGLGLSLLEGNKKPVNFGTLEGQASQLTAQGDAMRNYLATGTLPPGLEASLQSAADAARATVRSRYAASGATGSSAEQQDLQRVTDTMVQQGGQMAMNLFNQGLNETQLGDSLYAQLMQTTIQQDAALSSAVGNFAGALALSGAKMPAAA